MHSFVQSSLKWVMRKLHIRHIPLSTYKLWISPLIRAYLVVLPHHIYSYVLAMEWSRSAMVVDRQFPSKRFFFNFSLFCKMSFAQRREAKAKVFCWKTNRLSNAPRHTEDRKIKKKTLTPVLKTIRNLSNIRVHVSSYDHM